MANHYIRQGATGSNTGEDWTNAWTQFTGSEIKPSMWIITPEIVANNCTKNGMPVPVLAMPLWEGYGNIVHDVSGKLNNGTLTNNVTWVNGEFGVALYFNNNYVIIPNSASLNPNYISISAWVKSSILDSQDAHILSKDNSQLSGVRVWQFVSWGTSGHLALIVFNAFDYGIAEGTTNIRDGNLHYVAGTWDGTIIKVYVDKTLEGSTLYSGSLRTGQTNNAFIGKSENFNPGYWNGTIEEIEMYNTALTANQINFIKENPFFLYEKPSMIINGVLRRNTTNPRYFTDNSGKSIYLTGSHVWNNLQDFKGSGVSWWWLPNILSREPTHELGFNEYLNFLVAHNHNFIRMWMQEFTQDISTKETISPLPWMRTGPGNANDELPKFDLDRYNQSYFDRLRNYVIAAGNKGIYVSIMLFGGMWGTEHIENWAAHSSNIDNNINGINGDPNNDDLGNGTNELYTLYLTNALQKEKAYINKLVDTVNDLDNVLYEVANECRSWNTPWQYEIINYLKNYESTKPKQHPIGMTGYSEIPDSDLVNSPADWTSPSNYGGDYKSNPPVANGNKVLIIDSDHLWGLGGNPSWVWKSFMRGLNPIWMENIMMSSGDLPDAVAIRSAMGHTLTYANKTNLNYMIPTANTSICSTGYCLFNQGKQYLIYQPDIGSFIVNIPPNTYQYEWFRPLTGSIVNSGNITIEGQHTFTAPFNEEAVLYLSTICPTPTVLFNLNTI